MESKPTVFSSSTERSLRNDVKIFHNGQDTTDEKSSELSFTEFDLVNEIGSNNVNRFTASPEVIISSTRSSIVESTTPRITTTRAPSTTKVPSTTRVSTTTTIRTSTELLTTQNIPVTTTKPFIFTTMSTTKKQEPVTTTKPFIFTRKPEPITTQKVVTSTTQMPIRTTEDFGARNFKLLQQLLAQQIAFSQRPVIRPTTEMIPETTTEKITTTTTTGKNSNTS